jgi:hypothetical protein
MSAHTTANSGLKASDWSCLSLHLEICSLYHFTTSPKKPSEIGLQAEASTVPQGILGPLFLANLKRIINNKGETSQNNRKNYLAEKNPLTF